MPMTLGIHLGHDRAASIVREGHLQAHIAEERLDRVKHSTLAEIPFRSVDALLRSERLALGDFAAIGVTYANYELEAFLPEIRDRLADRYRSPIPPLIAVKHHLAHALSAFHTCDFSEALLFVADGAGDPVPGGGLEAESWYLASPEGVEFAGGRCQSFVVDVYDTPVLSLYPLMTETDRRKEMSFGYKYEQFTSLLGFGPQQEGTTMALAAFGRSLVDVRQYRFETLHYSVKRGDVLEEINKLRQAAGMGYPAYVRRERPHLARTIQDYVEHAILSILTTLRRETGRRHLCLSGGVFLNCVLNHKILESGLFDDVHIVPAAGDDGQSIGAAFEAYRQACGRPTCCSRSLPFLGLRHGSRSIRTAIERNGLSYERLTDRPLAQRVVSCLLEGKVVGILRGRSEIGPRALCHRSLLADPRSRRLRDRLNRKIKRRQMFRPFAPVVAAEDRDRFFELAGESRFMLLSGRVRKKYRRALCGVTHVDGSARVQAISAEEDPFVHRLLKLFERETGFPVLLNTSFNGRGEPIVEKPEDAIATFLKTGIDALVLGNYLITTRSPSPRATP